jgi:threonine dehydrogenase-like Zn-dependent dehydrogenase
MRALVLRDYGTMAVEEVLDPVLGDDEVLIRTVATGICGSDIHGFTGHNGRRFPGQVMGHETVGVVVELGSALAPDTLAIGTPVTFNPVLLSDEALQRFAGREQRADDRTVVGVSPQRPAAFAEFVAIPARNVVPLPTRMPIAHGALVEPLAVALHACRRVGVENRRVLVIGGGPIGQSIVLAARRCGAGRLWLSETNPQRRQLCERLDAEVLDPADGTPIDQLRAAGCDGADVAIDAVGTSETVSAALAAVVRGGSVCLVGMGDPQLSLPAYQISTDERTITGSFSYTYQTFRDAARWVGEGSAPFADLISDEVDLDDAPAAFARLAGPHPAPGKVLVRFRPPTLHGPAD